MPSERQVRLFRNGRNQALRIPRDLELDADEAIIRRDGARLIIEAVPRRLDLASLLASWQQPDGSRDGQGDGSWDGSWPDVDSGLQPLDDIRL